MEEAQVGVGGGVPANWAPDALVWFSSPADSTLPTLLTFLALVSYFQGIKSKANKTR